MAAVSSPAGMLSTEVWPGALASFPEGSTTQSRAHGGAEELSVRLACYTLSPYLLHTQAGHSCGPHLTDVPKEAIEILKLPRSCSAGRDSDRHQSWELIPWCMSNQDHIWSAKTPGDVARSIEARSAQTLIPGLALELTGFCQSLFTPEPQDILCASFLGPGLGP